MDVTQQLAEIKSSIKFYIEQKCWDEAEDALREAESFGINDPELMHLRRELRNGKQKGSSNKALIISVVTLLLLGGAAGVWFLLQGNASGRQNRADAVSGLSARDSLAQFDSTLVETALVDITPLLKSQIQAIYRNAWLNLSGVEQRYLTPDFLSKVQQTNNRYNNGYGEYDNYYEHAFVETFCLNVGDAPIDPELSPNVIDIAVTDSTHAMAHVRVDYVGLGTTDDVSLKFVFTDGQWKVDDIIRGGYSLLASLTDAEISSQTQAARSSSSRQLGEVTDPIDEYVNVRSGPGTEYGISTTLDVGETVFYEPSRSNWFRVYYEDGSFMGWIYHDRLRKL